MIDVTSFAVKAIAERNAWCVPLAFAAGAAVSVGPCVAPRVLTVAALTAGRSLRETAAVLGCFTAGLATAYAILAGGGSLIWRLLSYSSYSYTAVSVILAVAALVTLIRRDPSCAHTRPARSLGGTFLLGASSALTVSPCCLPVISAATAYASSSGFPLTAATAGAFAFGHCTPLLVLAGSPRPIVRTLSRGAAHRSAQVVGGSLLLALAAYYGILA